MTYFTAANLYTPAPRDRAFAPNLNAWHREAQAQILAASASPAAMRAVAVAIVNACREPGRAGVRAVCNYLTSAPRVALEDTLRAVWRIGPSRSAWAAGLATTWIGTSPAVLSAAGGIEGLREWFARARLLDDPPPFMRHALYRRDELPDEIEVWRGATTGRTYAADGLSWSLHRGSAAEYAVTRAEQHGGAPVVHMAILRPDQIVMATKSNEGEVVTLDPPKGEVDTRDRIEILTLRAASIVRRQPTMSDALITLGADDDEAAWCGWTGDDD